MNPDQPEANVSGTASRGNKLSSLASNSRKKIADQPHSLTILLSVAAIVVSAISWNESHQNRRLNEKLSRPIVRVINVSKTGPVMEFRDKVLITNRLTLKNSGRTFAKNVNISLRSQLDDERVGEHSHRFTDTEDVMSSQSKLGDLAPEDEDSVAFMANVLSKPPTSTLGSITFSPVALKTKGTLTYEDPLNGAIYTEDFCFALWNDSKEFSRCSN